MNDRSRQDEIELTDFNSNDKPGFFSNPNRVLEVGIADSLNLKAIFILFLKDTWTKFLEEQAKYYMFSFAAIGAALTAIFTWAQARKNKYEGNILAKAVIETVAAIGVAVAVLGGFLANTLFITISPIIFTAVMALKSLFHIGMAIKHGFQWANAKSRGDTDNQAKHLAAVGANLAGAAAGILSTIAVGLVMIAAKPIYAFLGIIGGAVGTAFCIYKRFFSSSAKKVNQLTEDPEQKPLLSKETDSTMTNSARLQRRLSNENAGKGIVSQSPDVSTPSAVRDQAAMSSTNSAPQTHQGTVSVTTGGTFRPVVVSSQSSVTATTGVDNQVRFA